MTTDEGNQAISSSGGANSTKESGQAAQDVAGAGQFVMESARPEPLTTRIIGGPVDDKIIHAKATRHIAGKYGLNLYGLEYLAGLACYLKINNRENVGVSEDRYIEWTGARTRWQKRMREGGAECLEMGAVEVIPTPSGKYYDITQKGRVILAEYCRRFEEIREDLEGRRAVAVLTGEAARLRVLTKRRKAERLRDATTPPGEPG